MGKNKKSVEKSEPEKIIRKLGDNLTIEVSEAEKRFRNKNGPDTIADLSKEKLKCTVCGISLSDALRKGNEPYVHMLLNVLMCRDCSTFYGDGYFSVDEDGDDKYCRWCGQGGTLYLCSTCTCAFCKKCIKQNLTRQDVKDLESDDWKCLICKPNPLFECRTTCWFLQENYKKKEESDNQELDKESKTTSQKSEEKRGSKRKASDDPVERSSKRSKNSSDVSTPDRRRTSQSNKETEKPAEEKPKSETSRTSKRKSSQLENEASPTPVVRNTSKRSSKVQEVVISDDDGEVENISKTSSPKKSRSQNSKENNSKKTTPSDDTNTRPKRSIQKKEIKSPETPKAVTKPANNKSNSSSGGRSKKKKTSVKTETPVKQSHRSITKIKDDDSDDESKKSDCGSQLVSLGDGDDSASETENKKRDSYKRGNIKGNKKSKKTKILLSKKADSSVVKASGYVNSAVTDVLELSVLIANRCDKLCINSVETADDLNNTINKLKHLMKGVHTNLELIEKGLDTKIDAWKGINTVDTPEDGAKTENKGSEEDEVKVTSSPKKEKDEGVKSDSNILSSDKENEEETKTSLSNSADKENEKENITTSENSLNEENNKESKTTSSSSPNKIKVEENKATTLSSLPSEENANKIEENETPTNSEEKLKENVIEQMDSEAIKDGTSVDQGEMIDKEEPIENVEESMDVDNEIKNTTVNESAEVDLESDNNSEEDKPQDTKAKQNDEFQNEENNEEKSSDDQMKTDDIDEKADSIHSTEEEESVDKSIANGNCETSNDDLPNQKIESGKDKSETNTGDPGKIENGNIENSESENKSEMNEEEKEISKSSEIEDKEQKSSIVEVEEEDSVSRDVCNSSFETEGKNKISDNTTKSSEDKLNYSQENGLQSSVSENVLKGNISQETLTCEEKDEVCSEKKEEEKVHPEVPLNKHPVELEKNVEPINKTPAKETQKPNELKSESSKIEDVKSENKEEKKQNQGSSELKKVEIKEDKKVIKPEDHQVIKMGTPPLHHVDRDSPRGSGDRPRWPGSRENRGHHSWNQDRWQGGRGSSWNRYDDRRPNRGGWNWR